MKIDKENWEIVELGTLLSLSKNITTVEGNENYVQIGIRLWGLGAYARESVSGTQTQYKFFYKAKEGNFTFNKIWARNGAVTVIQKELENYFVSPEFPVYEVDSNKLTSNWLVYITKSRWFWEKCNEKAFGTSGKNRIKPNELLSIEIPLPTVSEQYRIAKNIDNLKSKIDEVKRLREEQDKLRKNLLFSQFSNIIKEADWLPMREVAPIIRRDIQLDENASYPELGLRSFGKGTFHKPNLSGIDVGTKKLYQIKAGDLMFSNVFAWEGAIAVAKDIDEDRYGSHRFISCLVKEDQALADFLCFYFLTEKGMEDINAASPGGAGRNKTLGLDKLMRIKVPVLPLDIQKKFVNLITKLNEAKAHQIAQLEELERLFPAMLDKAFKGEL